jgi:hypothetical protein
MHSGARKGSIVDTRRHFDTWSFLVMAITLILFVVALFTKGFTHDLLLEAGVFLVSVKLILMAYKSSVATAMMRQKLDEIHVAVQQRERERPQ